MPAVRVLLVDDSVAIRCLVSAALACREIDICGTAKDGIEGVAKALELKPDVIVLDLEMPNMDGFGMLRELNKKLPKVKSIVFSSMPPEIALQTLSLGAAEFVPKPVGTRQSPEATAALATLKERVLSLGQRETGDFFVVGSRTSYITQLGAAPAQPAPRAPLAERAHAAPPLSTRRVQTFVGTGLEGPRIVVIGSSTGGPNALEQVLPLLEGDLNVPVVIVQHMPPLFTKLLAERLDKVCKLRVREAEDGAPLEPNKVLVAPGDFHLYLEKSGDGVVARLNKEPPENSVRPAVDVLFRTAAAIYGRKILSVVLTGMGSDGLKGCEQIRAAGGDIIVQDEASSVVWGMPGYVAKAGLARAILPLANIGAEINQTVKKGALPSRRTAGADLQRSTP